MKNLSPITNATKDFRFRVEAEDVNGERYAVDVDADSAEEATKIVERTKLVVTSCSWTSVEK